MASNLNEVPEQTRIDEQRAALDAARSLLTIKRFGWKVGFFAAFAALQATVGQGFPQGFLKHLASLALAATMFGIMVGHWRRERVRAPYYTHFDEAVWFMLLAGTADRLAA